MILYILCAIIIFFILFKIICVFPLPFPRFQFNPSALYTFYGAPGSGKSTLACWMARKAISCGVTVYSNMPIDGCREFQKSDLGVWNMENCLVLWDEVG